MSGRRFGRPGLRSREPVADRVTGQQTGAQHAERVNHGAQVQARSGRIEVRVQPVLDLAYSPLGGPPRSGQGQGDMPTVVGRDGTRNQIGIDESIDESTGARASFGDEQRTEPSQGQRGVVAQCLQKLMIYLRGAGNIIIIQILGVKISRRSFTKAVPQACRLYPQRVLHKGLHF